MKIGIVGMGSIGTRHYTNARELGHEVVAYDPMKQRDVRFERNIYEQADAVVIATPSFHHPAAIRACAERGKHMLVEKPIGTGDADGIDMLLEFAKLNGASVMMANNLRFHPAVIAAKTWITGGHIGRPLWASFVSGALSVKPGYLSDGVLLITGAHEVDLALHLLGPAKVVSAAVRTTDSFEDMADFVLEHESGARSSFHLDLITTNEIREFWIAGSERNIGVELLGRNASLGKITTGFPGDYSGDYVEEMRAFIERCEGKEAPGATGADGLATLRILLDVKKMAGIG